MASKNLNKCPDGSGPISYQWLRKVYLCLGPYSAVDRKYGPHLQICQINLALSYIYLEWVHLPIPITGNGTTLCLELPYTRVWVQMSSNPRWEHVPHTQFIVYDSALPCLSLCIKGDLQPSTSFNFISMSLRFTFCLWANPMAMKPPWMPGIFVMKWNYGNAEAVNISNQYSTIQKKSMCVFHVLYDKMNQS